MEVERIAEELESLWPEQALERVLAANSSTQLCLTSSFQAEDMVVAHVLKKRIPDIPVLLLDTGYHFAQTYEYRDRMTRQWSLNLVNVLPAATVEALMRALEPFDVWFTGLRREQSPMRKNLN